MFFFLVYRPSCLIEASFRSEKCWLVCVGLLATHLFGSNLIFPSGGFFVEAEGVAVFADMSAASQSHSAAMDGHRAARFECCIAWTFACKTHKIENSSKFKSSKYCGQSAENRNFANSRWVVLAVLAGA
jgi:hypothetical protein